MHQHRNHDADIQISFVVPNKQTQQSGFLQEMSSFQQDNDNLQQLWAEDTITTKQFDETLHSVEQLAQHTLDALSTLDQRLSQLLNTLQSIQRQATKGTNVCTNIESCVEVLNEILDNFDTFPATQNLILSGISCHSGGVDQYISQLERIEKAIKSLQVHSTWKSAASTQQSLTTLHSHGLQQLHDYFDTLLHRHSLPNEDRLPPAPVLIDLQKITSSLTRANVTSWITTYTSRRRHWLLESIQRTLEPDITLVTLPYSRGTHRYIHSLHTLLHRLTIERQLCVSLFPVRTQCYEIYRTVITPALDKWSDVSDKLLDYLLRQHRQGQALVSLSILCDIWDTFHTLLPQFEQVLCCEIDIAPKKENRDKGSENFTLTSDDINNNSKKKKIFPQLTSSVPNPTRPPLLTPHVTEFWASLTSVVRECFSEFRAQIQQDPLDKLASDGTVSPVTAYTLNVLQALLTYSHCVSQLLPPLPSIADKSTLGVYILRVLSDLFENLEAKAKKAKRSSLAHIFLLNNYHFIWKTIKQSNLLAEVGESTLREYFNLYEKEKKAYMTCCWQKVLSCLSEGDDKDVQSDKRKGESISAIKQRFQVFNDEFTELYKTQIHYLIPDDELRNQIRRELVDLLLPRYQTFFNKYTNTDFANKEKYMHYTPLQVEQMLNCFFEGVR